MAHIRILSFIKNCWMAVGDDVRKVVLSILNGALFVEGLNHTDVAPIPKNRSLVKLMTLEMLVPITFCTSWSLR